MAQEQSPNRPAPVSYGAEEIKNESINQRIELWLSKREELTSLEIALKLSGFQRGKAFQWPPASQHIKSACSIPAADDLGYWYVPCDDSFVGAPVAIQQKAKRWQSFISQPSVRDTMEQVERNLDLEILERCHLMGMIIDIKLVQSLAQCSFAKKVHICAKNRLVEVRLLPYFEPGTPDAQSRFRFVAVDIDEKGAVDPKWCHLDWASNLQTLRDAVLAHSSSAFATHDVGTYLRKIHDNVKCPIAKSQAKELIAQFNPQLLEQADDETELAVGWINVDLSKKDQILDFRATDISSKTFTWTPIRGRLDFFNMMQTAQMARLQENRSGGADYPVFMRPWQVDYHTILRKARRIHALMLMEQYAAAKNAIMKANANANANPARAA